MSMIGEIRKKQQLYRLVRRVVMHYPGGLCMADENGRVILANSAINKIFLEKTGHTVLNAAESWSELEQKLAGQRMAVPQEFLRALEKGRTDGGRLKVLELADGSFWQIQRKIIPVHDISYIEISAENITDLYRYSCRLHENNIRIADVQKRQRALLNNLSETNLKKETLQAKMKIHDEFGQCLIATQCAQQEHTLAQNQKELLQSWESVVDNLLAASENHTRSVSPEAEVRKAARMIGCQIDIEGAQPRERQAQLLLYEAIREALTNAVRHAGADRLFVEIHSDSRWYYVKIYDNGTARPAEISEGVGLGTLREHFENEGAKLTVVCDNGVVLMLRLPKPGGEEE